MSYLHRILCVGLALFSLSKAHAGLIFDLSPSSLTGNPGTVVHFSGKLSNPDSGDVYLNGDSSVLLYTALVVDDLPFFADTPLFLAPGDSYLGPLFNVDIDASASTGVYLGSFTIVGGGDSNTFNNLASQDFQVTVTGIPEPGTLLEMITGCICITLISLRARWKVR